ncbi:MAG: septum formation initiator family protein [Synergistetes bacterium]|nr:septum formation initiator family protein [Synergistota bacterium]MCX8127609.1 septum formation initiator family protein [Synergistota bacterium]MDW8191474.1 septum formation initiator family protein [Synergistota bacterium]
MIRKWLSYALFIFILSVTSISIIREVRKIILFDQRAYLLRVKISELEAENKNLREKIRLAESGFLLEKIVREELKMAKPGEMIFFFREGGEENGAKAGERKR